MLDTEPAWARELTLVPEHHVLSEATARVHAALREVLDAGRGRVIVGSQLTPPTVLVAELLCTALWSVIRARLLTPESGPLSELVPSLMEHIVEPYLGAGAQLADRLSDPSLPERAPTEARILPLRAHPRVLLAMRVIAASPGLSTRGVELQVSARRERGGELSQVLNPLEQRGLLENSRSTSAEGQAHAWRLTAYGRRALELLDERSRRAA